jgi:pyruvate dehydrogenase E2 component (dihydrolipoamide acetyltransferase)
MRLSVIEIPHVTLHRSVNVTTLLEARKRLNESRKSGVNITMTACIAKLAAVSLQRYPRLNGCRVGEEIQIFRNINVAIAVAIEDGVVAPVIRDADLKTSLTIAEELAEFAERARTDQLSIAELSDATFTITNLGTSGIEYFTPIITPPQLAVLGIGTIVGVVQIVEGVAREVPRLGLSLSFDHASLDGIQAAKYLSILADLMESPFVLEPDYQ